MTVHELSRRDARRIAIRAQRLDRARPSGMFDVIRELTHLQVDPTAAVAPTADLVLWSRLGSAYHASDLESALDYRTLIELRGMIRPREDLPLYRAEMAEWSERARPRERDWVVANDAARREVLDRLVADGPLTLAEMPVHCAVQWTSSGWNNDRNVQILLNFMVQRGEVASAGRRDRDRLWDLAGRVYPAEVTPIAEAFRVRNERRLQSLGIARARGPECPVEPSDVGEVGEAAVIDGVRGVWRVDPAQLGRPFSGRAALLSPYDRLIYDRKRMTEVFEFDYALEMYKPADKRQWGYYALPILYGDRLVGKLDATADRKAGVLRVDAIHEDEPLSKAAQAAIVREIKDLARWLRLDLDLPADIDVVDV